MLESSERSSERHFHHTTPPRSPSTSRSASCAQDDRALALGSVINEHLCKHFRSLQAPSGIKQNVSIRKAEPMATQTISAHQAGTVTLGGELAVNRLGFGAMRITGEGVWGPPKDRTAALAVLRRAVELGVNFIDTADSFGPGVR